MLANGPVDGVHATSTEAAATGDLIPVHGIILRANTQAKSRNQTTRSKKKFLHQSAVLRQYLTAVYNSCKRNRDLNILTPDDIAGREKQSLSNVRPRDDRQRGADWNQEIGWMFP